MLNKKEALRQLDQLEQFYVGRRWIQRHLTDMAGGYCLLGACFAANVPELSHEFQRTIKGESILQWNDSDWRTFEDVKKLIAETRTRLQSPVPC